MKIAPIACLLLVASAAATSARAGGPFDAAQARDQAKKDATQAQIDYDAGRFLPALEGYTRAYDLAPVPELLFNIGQCHFQLASYERAVFFYQAYLHDRPDAANRALVEDLLAEARREQDKREAARAVPLPLAPARREAALAESSASPPIYHRWWFWAAMGAAAVAVGGTAYLLHDDGGGMLPARSLGTVDAR